MALVRDQFSGRQMARLMSFVMAVFILVPALAPLLGQGILWLGSWRTIFTTFFAVAAVSLAWVTLRQPETLPVDRRRPFSVRAIGQAVGEIVRIRTSLGYTLATGLVFAPFVAYLSSAQQIFQDAYQTGVMFSVYFGSWRWALASAGLSTAAWSSGMACDGSQRSERPPSRWFPWSRGSACSSSTGFHRSGSSWRNLLVVFLFIGLVFGNLNALAMEPLGHIAGVGAAVVTSLSTLISVPLGSLIGQSFDGTLHTQVGAFALFGSLTLGAMLWAEPPSSRGD